MYVRRHKWSHGAIWCDTIWRNKNSNRIIQFLPFGGINLSWSIWVNVVNIAWFSVKPRIFKKTVRPSGFFAVIFWQTGSWLSGNCLVFVRQLSGWFADERNSDDRNRMRWQNHGNRDMGGTTSTYWADVWQQICPTGASSVPTWGKHVAPVGQAACPILLELSVH